MPFDYDEDAPSMQASVQAGALEELGKDASIQALHRKLAAAGAAAMQPKGSTSMMVDEPEPEQDAYMEVEPDAPEDF